MTRLRLPSTRKSLTHRVKIHTKNGPIKCFITVGLYDDGQPGEVFLTMDEAGSTLDGFADAWATSLSICFQSGNSIKPLLEKFAYQEFEPKGRTDNQKITFARSIVDYVARWMLETFKPE